MNDYVDMLLREDLLQPPPDFTQRVMKNLTTQVQPSPHAQAHSAPRLSPPAARGRAPHGPAVWPRLRWLAARAGLAGGGLLSFVLGLDQLASFVFGLWLAGAAL